MTSDNLEQIDDAFETVEQVGLDVDAPIKANKKVKTSRRGAGAVSWLALLFALAATAGSAYTYWQQQELSKNAAADLVEFEDSASVLKRDMKTDVQSRLNSFSTENQAQLNSLNKSNKALQRKLSLDVEELDARLAENENKVVTLRGFSDAAKYAYVRAEIEYFLQTANNRIQLAQDTGSALAALKAANERFTVLNDPSLVRVRAQLKDEITALSAVVQPDIQDIALTLASLSKRVTKLPLRMDDAEDYYQEEIKLKEGEGFRVGLSNIWRNMRGTLDKLVEVRAATPSDVPLLSQEDTRLLYTNLDIQLQSARLASLKGDAENYNISLSSAADYLKVYFDSEQPEVQATIKTLQEIQGVKLSPVLPDISASLKMLRAVNSAEKAPVGNVSTESVPVEPAPNE